MRRSSAMSDTIEAAGTNVQNVITSSSVGGGVETQTKKHVVKLTAKALANELDRLQSGRKAKLNQTAIIRKSIQDLMLKHDKTKVQDALDELLEVCHEAKYMHNNLLDSLPCEEKEKHEIWFKAKMLPINECIANTKMWVSNDDSVANENGNVVDEVNPDDSVSNISKHSSHRSRSSVRSSTVSSAAIKVEAERAALVALAAALKERHDLEEQEQQLKRKREQLDLQAEIAASTAKLAVLQASERRGSSQAHSNGMNSYLEKEKKKRLENSVTTLNPMAKMYRPVGWKSTQNGLSKWSLPPKETILKDVQPKETEQWVQAASMHQCSQKQQQQVNISETSLHFQHQSSTAQPMQQHHIGQSPPDILTIMQRQNEITAALVQQQHMMTLPPRDIPTFEGDPLHYRTFIKAFEQGVEEKAGQADCLYYLEQFTRGQPRELVRSCQHMAPERGYAVAKELLQKHFGNQYKIASAYMEKALAWQTIKSEDVRALQAYSLFLRGCCNVMEELQYMQELNMPVNIRAIVSKLPFRMREQWRTIAHDIMETTNQPACFMDMVMFIERRVSILSDPLFGEIQESSGVAGIKSVTGFKAQPRYNMKGNVMATTITSMEALEKVEEPTAGPEKTECLCCARSHSLEDCKQFKGWKHKEKIQILRQRGVCFACLCVGHMSRDCEDRLTCKICSQTHPTVLHIKRQPAPEKSETSHQPTSPKTCGYTGAGKDRCVLSILPVKVKSAKGNHIIKTYAFLDPGSSATFCSEQLMRKLNITGRKNNFLLSTMGQKKVVPAYSLIGLEVSTLDSNDFHILPEVLTQTQMPVNINNMVTSEELAKWPYLSKVNIPNIKANVDLLIGTNAPRILEPWEVINSSGNGPYAIKTVLGWVVNGPLNGNSGASEVELPLAMVNRISVCKLEEMLVKQYSYELNEKQHLSEAVASLQERAQSNSEARVREVKVKDQIKQLENQNTSLNNQMVALQRHTTTLQEQNSGLLTQTAKLQVENSTLSSQSASLMAQNAVLQGQVTALETEVESWQRQREEAWRARESVLSDHERLLSVHERQAHEYEQLISQHASLKGKQRALENEHRTLHNKYCVLVQQKEKWDEHEGRGQKEKEELNQETQKNRLLQQENLQLKTEVDRLTESQSQHSDKNEGLQQRINELKSSLSSTQLEVSQWMARYDSLMEQHQGLDLTMTKLDNHCELLSRLKGNLEEENHHLLSQINLLSQQNHTMLEKTMESKERYHQEQKLYIDKLNSLRRQKEKLEEKIMDQYKFYDPTPKKRSQWTAKAFAKLIKPRKESCRERGGDRDREVGKEKERSKSAPDIPLPALPQLLPPETPPPLPQRTGCDSQNGGHAHSNLSNHSTSPSLGPKSPAPLTPISRGLTDRNLGVYRNSTPGGSSESVNGEDGHVQGQIHKVLSSTPNHLPPSLVQTNSSSSRVGPGLSRRPRGVLLDEDSCHNTSDSVFGHHGNVGGRPGSADFSHNTSSSNSPVNFRDSVDCQPRSASLSSDDIMGLSRSQLTLSRSSTLPYDQTPQRAQPQRGGGVKTKTRSSSPGSQMVTLEEFLQESNVQSPPMVSTGSREDLMTDYFTRSPAPSAPTNRDQVTPTSYVMPTVQTSNQRPGQSVKPSPRQPVGQSPSSGQRTGQSLSRAFSLASADLLRSSGPDSFRGNETGPGQSDVVVRRQGGGANVRERPLSARLAGPNTQLADSSFLNPPIHHSSSLNLPTERYAERERERERERGRAPVSRNGPSSSSSYHHRGEVAMVTPVRAVPATQPNEASEVSREGQSGDSSHLKKESERARSGSVERPKSTPASPDPNNDPQTVWYEYGCV